jgi:hypothetical protein
VIGRSLRLRLALAGALALCLALGIARVGLTLLFERHLYRTLSDDLDVGVRRLIGGIEVDPSGKIGVARPPQDPRFYESFPAFTGKSGPIRFCCAPVRFGAPCSRRHPTN